MRLPLSRLCASALAAAVLWLSIGSHAEESEYPEIREVSFVEVLIPHSGRGFANVRFCQGCPVEQFVINQKTEFMSDDHPISRRQARRAHWQFGFMTYQKHSKEVLLLNKMP